MITTFVLVLKRSPSMVLFILLSTVTFNSSIAESTTYTDSISTFLCNGKSYDIKIKFMICIIFANFGNQSLIIQLSNSKLQKKVVTVLGLLMELVMIKIIIIFANLMEVIVVGLTSEKTFVWSANVWKQHVLLIRKLARCLVKI